MAFPASPTNGQTTTINSITYVFNSTLGVWSKQGSVSTASPVSSVASRTGAVTLTAADVGAGTFPGALIAGSTLSTNGVLSAASGTTSTSTTTGALVVTGGVGISGALYIAGAMSTAAITSSGTITAAAFSTSGALTAGSLSVSGINSTPIGATTQSTGAFTTLSGGSTQLNSLGVGTAASGTQGEIRATNYITAFYSDKRLKTEIGRIENALDKIDQLTGILYTQNALAEQFGYNNYETQVGLRAQDVQIVQPEAVKPAPFDIAEDGSSKSGENYLTVQYEKLVPLLVEAIKELRVELNLLKGGK